MVQQRRLGPELEGVVREDGFDLFDLASPVVLRIDFKSTKSKRRDVTLAQWVSAIEPVIDQSVSDEHANLLVLRGRGNGTKAFEKNRKNDFVSHTSHSRGPSSLHECPNPLPSMEKFLYFGQRA